MAHHADIKGLPLILGGEIRAISKLPGRDGSTVVLLRGAAGTGKTIFATHLAAHEALVRNGDVVYCCVELLPSELDAQISALTFGAEQRMLRVSNVPGGAAGSGDLAPRIFASIIDIPDDPEPDFGTELQRVIGDARQQGMSPKVIVIDSLTDGYRLGASVPRYLADGLAKFAADEGILVILLEEVVERRDSAWTFVADVVLELAHHGAVGTSAAEDRAVTVRKNRFGPAHVGPHVFAIHQSNGVEIYPRLSVYGSSAMRASALRGRAAGTPRPWRIVHDRNPVGIPAPGEIVLVTGTDAIKVRVALERLVVGGHGLRVDLASTALSEDRVLRCGDPMLGPERMLAGFCSKFAELPGSVSEVAIGDLSAIKQNIDPEGLGRALFVIVMIVQASGLPVVLFETASERGPWSSHMADTIVEVTAAPHRVSGAPSILGTLSSRSRNLLGLQVEIP